MEDYSYLNSPPAPVDPLDHPEWSEEERAEHERDVRLANHQTSVLMTYRSMRERGAPEAHVDRFFDGHRALLEEAGVTHYPLLSDEEKAVIAGWQDLQARNERQSIIQSYWSKHHDVLSRRWLHEHGCRWPLD